MGLADVSEEEMKDSLDVCEAFVETGGVLRNWIKGLIIPYFSWLECQHMVRRRKGENLC